MDLFFRIAMQKRKNQIKTLLRVFHEFSTIFHEFCHNWLKLSRTREIYAGLIKCQFFEIHIIIFFQTYML